MVTDSDTSTPSELPAPDAVPAKDNALGPIAGTSTQDNRGGFNRGGGNGGGGFNRGGGPGGNNRGPRRDGPRQEVDDGISEKVVFINRCAKVVKGGRRFSFSALVVCGDKEGKVGLGFGKAKEVSDAIKKGGQAARKNMSLVCIVNGTLPHETYAEFGGGKVLLKPASPGTGIIAGGGVRAVCEAAGVKDILAKSMGSSNHANVVKATIKALSALRTRETILSSRGKKTREKSI
jgi:small subunit ribosomal protein S5